MQLTRQQLAEKIQDLASQLRSVSFQILFFDEVPPIPGFVCSFIRYQATQGFRIAEWLKKSHVDDVDLIAHATRGLFESSLLYWHLMKGGGADFLKNMASELGADHFDTMKAMKAICGGGQMDEDFEKQLSDYEALKLKKTPPIRDLAKKVGAEEEYKATYSFFSKYTHPTMYQLVGDYREVFSVEACLIFGDRAAWYLRQILDDSTKILEFVSDHNANVGNVTTQAEQAGPSNDG